MKGSRNWMGPGGGVSDGGGWKGKSTGAESVDSVLVSHPHKEAVAETPRGPWPKACEEIWRETLGLVFT